MLIIRDDGYVGTLCMDVSEMLEEALQDDGEDRETNNFEIDLHIKVKNGQLEVSSDIIEGEW